MGWRDSHSWLVLSHTLVLVLCLAWRNPRLIHNDLVKISTVRELLKASCEKSSGINQLSLWNLVIPLLLSSTGNDFNGKVSW